MGRPIKEMFGFTLIEVLVTASIVLILALYAVPANQQLLQRNRLNSHVNVIASHLAMTKSTAFQRNTSVTLCPSANQETCDDTFEWHHGWMVFEDRNRNQERDEGEGIIQANGRSGGQILILTSAGRRRVTFSPQGGSSGSNVTFSFCDRTRRAEPRFLILSNQGRVRASPRHPSLSQFNCGL